MHDHFPTSLVIVLARLGYLAQGLVYLVIGYFAVSAAIGGQQVKGSRSAIIELASGPLGEVLVGIVAIGLLGYAVWRLAQAGLDADNHGRDLRGIAIRGGFAVSGLVHAALGLWAISLLLGGSDDGGQGDWSVRLMQQPYGRWVVGLSGLGLAAGGIAHIVKAAQQRFRQHLEAEAARMKWITPISQIGLSARGLTFVLVGGLVVIGAWRYKPQHVQGLEGALQVVEQAPWGGTLLAAIGAGLLAFAVYSFIQAVYRRVDPHHDGTDQTR